MTNQVARDLPEEFDALPVERQEKLLNWITTNLSAIKSFNDDYTSYGLKHLVSFDDGSNAYYTNGEFKGAMLKAGYKVKSFSDLNWVFNISKRSPAFTK